MDKHTPGPWVLSDMVVRQPQGGGTIVACAPLYANRNWEANARLIAAAPDMLELLDDVSAIAQNMLAIQGRAMTSADRASRTKLIAHARELCDRLLRGE